MFLETQVSVRPVEEKDRTQIASLTHFSPYVHRHLDWRSPTDWIGHSPYLTLESDGKLLAALSCAPDLPETAWVRVFVCASSYPHQRAWDDLWPGAVSALRKTEIKQIAAIPIQKWFRELIENAGFIRIHDIVTLAWDYKGEQGEDKNSLVMIRDMLPQDIESILEIDHLAFDDLWQHSQELIELAYSQAAFATVALKGEKILGYQISTATQYGAHLARLAVHPQAQGVGIGYRLLRDLQNSCWQTERYRISVNTHDTNQRSLALYKKAGFKPSPESYPVFNFNI
jgi:ribosomal protein S18 acetylase RimI-like enzyme